MNFKFDKEMVMTGLNKAGQLSKVVVVEGIKAVALKGAAKMITTGFDEGLDGIKKLSFDEVTGIEKKEKKPKKKLFSKKDEKVEVVEELLEEVVEETVEDKLEKAKKILEDK